MEFARDAGAQRGPYRTMWSKKRCDPLPTVLPSSSRHGSLTLRAWSSRVDLLMERNHSMIDYLRSTLKWKYQETKESWLIV